MPSKQIPARDLPPPGEWAFGLFRSRHAFRTTRPGGSVSWLLVYTLEGSGRFHHATEPIDTARGHLILIPPGVRHDYGMEENRREWQRAWVLFQPLPHWYEWLRWPRTGSGLMHLMLKDATLQAKVEESIREAVLLAHSHWRRRDPLASNALERVLLWCDAAHPKSRQRPLDSRIRGTLDYIERHLAEPIQLGLLASQCGLSVSRFCALFRSQIQKPPQQYLEGQRMARARQFLLQTDHPVSEISREVGYPDPFYFSLRFKKHCGTGPRAFRKTNQTPKGKKHPQKAAKPGSRSDH